MRQGLSVRSWMLFVTVVAAGDAGALSRAMWAEFNAIYYINLRPTAECNAYRTRSIELLKDNSLSADALDARMRALWDEAKRTCLQPVRAEAAAAAKQSAAGGPTGLKQEAVNPSAVAQATAKPAERPAVGPAVATPERSAPGAPPVVDPSSALGANAGQERSDPAPLSLPSTAATGGTSSPPASDPAAAASPASAAAPPVPGPPPAAPGALVVPPVPGVAGPARIAPPLLKPPIELPSPADLRLEAACAKRNPYAYQAQAGTDPCARFARTTAGAATGAGAGANDGSSNRDWAARIGAGLAVAVAVGAVWAWRRQRARRAQGAPGDRADAVETDDGPALPVRAPA